MRKVYLFVALLPLAMALYTSADAVSPQPADANANAGDETKTISPRNEFSIWMNSHEVAEFQKQGQDWSNKDPNAFTNWAFFQNFINSLQDFRIDIHVKADEVKPDAASFELRIGARDYVFKKVGDRTWGVQLPNSKEFLASRDFSFYGDMDASTWASPIEKSLRILKDPTAAPDLRLTALHNLKQSGSPDVMSVMKKILLTEGDSVELRQAIVDIMRKQPTDQNIKTLVAVLKTSKDELLLNHVSKALRVRNPKGPVIQLDDSEKDIREKVSTWIAWGSHFHTDAAN